MCFKHCSPQTLVRLKKRNPPYGKEEGNSSPLSVENLLTTKDRPLTEQDKKALSSLKRALEADIRNVTAAVLV